MIRPFFYKCKWIRMKILIAIVFLLIAGISWLMQQRRNSKNAGTSRSMIDGLKSGHYGVTSFAETLSMNVRSFPLAMDTDPASAGRKLAGFTGNKLLEKFNVLHAQADQQAAVVIAEAVIKDFVQGYNNQKEIDLLYPCWMYVDARSDEGQVYFRSSMPTDKDHQFLLEDLADEIYKQCYS